MRKFFNGLVVGIVLSAAAFWYVQATSPNRPKEPGNAPALTNNDFVAKEPLPVSTNAWNIKLETFDLQADQIRAELKKSGEIIRRKPHDIGEAAAGPDSDAHTVAEIKAKYLADSKLSAWNISVSCAHGHTALIGTVGLVDDIGRAIAMALATDGVRDVTSTLQVKSN